MTKHDLFLSYSRKDLTFARHIRDMLKSEGYDVWMDEQQLYASLDWWRSIQAAIHSSEAVLLIMSPDAQNSEYVNKELQTARRAGIAIIPVLYLGSGWYTLARIQYIEMTTGMAITIPPPKLIQGIEAAKKSTQWRRQVRQWGRTIVAFLVVALIVGFIVSQSTSSRVEQTGTPEPAETDSATNQSATFTPAHLTIQPTDEAPAITLQPTATDGNISAEATVAYVDWLSQTGCIQDARLQDIAIAQTEYLSGLSLPDLESLRQEGALSKDAQGLTADQRAAIKGYPGTVAMETYAGEAQIRFEDLLAELPPDFSCKASGFAQFGTELNGQKRYYAALIVGDETP